MSRFSVAIILESCRYSSHNAGRSVASAEMSLSRAEALSAAAITGGEAGWGGWLVTPDEGGAPGVGRESCLGQGWIFFGRLPGGDFGMYVMEGAFGGIGQLQECLAEVWRRCSEVELALLGVDGLLAVATPAFRQCGRVVTIKDCEGGFGQAVINQVRCRAEQSVADLDVCVEEGQRAARFECFEPERHFGQFRRKWIEVNAIEAVADDVAHGVAKCGFGRFCLTGSVCSEPPCYTAACGDEEVP